MPQETNFCKVWNKWAHNKEQPHGLSRTPSAMKKKELIKKQKKEHLLQWR
jgi:hypothetical protein